MAAVLNENGAEHGLHLVTGVGQWIAAQGKAVLRDLQDELRETLAERLQTPLLPAAH